MNGESLNGINEFIEQYAELHEFMNQQQNFQKSF